MKRTLLLLSILGLSACATVEGAGRDISAAGDLVADGARQIQRAF